MSGSREPPRSRLTGTAMSESPADNGFELAMRCRAGDEQAWAQLYASHSQRMTCFLRRLVGDTPDLEDLVQQVFLGALSSLDRFRGDARFDTWLHGIACHVAENHQRWRFRQWRRNCSYLELGDWAASLEPDPARRVEARQILEATSTALGELDFHHRVVWVMSEIQGLDSGEVAQALGIPSGTVRSRLFEARRRLTAALAAAGLGEIV